MIDSHCHLVDPAFAADLDEVVGRARDAGVREALCVIAVGDEAEAAQARRLAALWPEAGFSAGIHPHQAGPWAGRAAEAEAAVRAALATAPGGGARALGEIGLDYHYEFAPRAAQQEVFRLQLRLARELRLPVILHTREAEDDTFAVLAEEAAAEVGGIFHCFTGDAAMARRGLDLGFHVSFAGIVTFPRAAALREAARLVPDDRLLVETDAPYLAPPPFRGRRNEPAWVGRVYDTLAEVRGQPREALTAAVARTYDALLARRPRPWNER